MEASLAIENEQSPFPASDGVTYLSNDSLRTLLDENHISKIQLLDSLDQMRRKVEDDNMVHIQATKLLSKQCEDMKLKMEKSFDLRRSDHNRFLEVENQYKWEIECLTKASQETNCKLSEEIHELQKKIESSKTIKDELQVERNRVTTLTRENQLNKGKYDRHVAELKVQTVLDRVSLRNSYDTRLREQQEGLQHEINKRVASEYKQLFGECCRLRDELDVHSIESMRLLANRRREESESLLHSVDVDFLREAALDAMRKLALFRGQMSDLRRQLGEAVEEVVRVRVDAEAKALAQVEENASLRSRVTALEMRLQDSSELAAVWVFLQREYRRLFSVDRGHSLAVDVIERAEELAGQDEKFIRLVSANIYAHEGPSSPKDLPLDREKLLIRLVQRVVKMFPHKFKGILHASTAKRQHTLAHAQHPQLETYTPFDSVSSVCTQIDDNITETTANSTAISLENSLRSQLLTAHDTQMHKNNNNCHPEFFSCIEVGLKTHMDSNSLATSSTLTAATEVAPTYPESQLLRQGSSELLSDDSTLDLYPSSHDADSFDVPRTETRELTVLDARGPHATCGSPTNPKAVYTLTDSLPSSPRRSVKGVNSISSVAGSANNRYRPTDVVKIRNQEINMIVLPTGPQLSTKAYGNSSARLKTPFQAGTLSFPISRPRAQVRLPLPRVRTAGPAVARSFKDEKRSLLL